MFSKLPTQKKEQRVIEFGLEQKAGTLPLNTKDAMFSDNKKPSARLVREEGFRELQFRLLLVERCDPGQGFAFEQFE